MVKPFVYYYPLDLSEPEQGRMRDSLKRLQRRLAEPPVARHCSISRLPSSAEKGVLTALQEPDLEILAMAEKVVDAIDEIGTLTIGEVNTRLILTRLVVRCPRGNPLAQRCLQALPLARWGLHVSRLAVVYNDSEPALWHEVLHLLGAKDCYDLPADPGPTCEHPRCIMQYAPIEGEVGGKLQICPENAERIQRVLSQITD